MHRIFQDWYQRNFSDPQAVILVLLLVVILSAILLVGNILAPLLVAVVIAYLLEGLVGKLERVRVPRMLAVSLVMIIFIVLAGMALFALAPLLSRQVAQLLREIPGMVAQGQALLMQLPEEYPALFSEEQIRTMIGTMHGEIADFGRAVLSVSLEQAFSVFALVIYVILVPLLVFFMLKDKDRILKWIIGFLPHRRELSFQVWKEVDANLGNYVRGKVIEILIVWAVTYVVFSLFGLNFALLLSFLVGVSVIIPYVGAIAVTFPVAIIAYFQWGFAAEFWWLLIAYQIIQILDGNVLVPILFSEVVNLHPVAIIAAVLFFGGLWGIWGIFFAIPLATVIKAVINAWPRVASPEELAQSPPDETA